MAFHFDSPDDMPPGMRALYEQQYGSGAAKEAAPKASKTPKVSKPKSPKVSKTEKEGNAKVPKSKKNKLGAQKVEIDGLTFDSKKEGKRYVELKNLEAEGKISNLQMQVRYNLIPPAREPDTFGVRGGVKKGKIIERGIDYIADFEYTENETGEKVTEDAKGYRNPQSAAYAKFVLKRKMMLYFHGIRVKEI